MLYAFVPLFLAVRLAAAQCPTNIDMCSPDEYSVRDEPDRSSAFYVQGWARGDLALPTRWYRFTSRAGGDMPRVPLYTGQCNSIAPIWLNGAIPTVNDGLVNVRACASFSENTCVRMYHVPIVNCGDFRVYCLYGTANPFDRWCIGSERLCPEGLWSPNGFTPNCRDISYLILVGDPVITVSVAYHTNITQLGSPFCTPFYVFSCDIDHIGVEVYYDVHWLAGDGTVLIAYTGDNALNGSEIPTSINSDFLIERGYKIGTTLTCRMALRENQTEEAYVGPTKSMDFFAGIVVPDSSQFIELSEGGDPAYYEGNFTIPFRCGFLATQSDTCTDAQHRCAENIGIIISHVHANGAECSSSSDVIVRAPIRDRDGCVVDTYEYGFSMEVLANPDHTYNPRRQLVLQLRTVEGSYNSFWAGCDLPRAVVSITDTEHRLQGKHCVISDDPHIQSFDGTKYTDVQMEGIFLMYRHRSLPISVEVYFKRSHERYTSNCGGAVRSGPEVFVFDACRDGEPWRVTAYECAEGLRNMTVTRLSDSKYEILLPTGTRVQLGTARQYVYPSIYDWEQTEGLCGNFNGIDSDEDDKIIRGENRPDTPTSSPHFGDRFKEYNVFSNSYRVPQNESLYFGYVQDEENFDNVSFCVCSGDNDNPGARCSHARNVDCVAGDHQQSSGEGRRCTLARRRKRAIAEDADLDDTPADLFPFNPQFIAQNDDWKNGWTVESAQQFCERMFGDSPNARACRAVPNVNQEEAVASCVADIYITGETGFSQLHVDVMSEVCRAEVAMYIYEPDNDTDTELPFSPEDAVALIAQVCPNECSESGACVSGNCACDEGFTDEDCSLDLNHIPVLFDLPSNATCDLSRRPCEMIGVSADQFVLDSVYCKLRLRNINQDAISGSVIMEAEYLHAQRAVCPISLNEFNVDEDSVDDPYIIDISASNNGVDFSGVKQLTVFNGICWSCVGTECNLEGGRCYIDNTCYEQGQTDPQNEDQICDTTRDAFSWQPDCQEFHYNYDRRNRFQVTVTKAKNKKKVKNNFENALMSSGSQLRVDLTTTRELKLALRPTRANTVFSVTKFCVDTRRVKQVKVELFNSHGIKLSQFIRNDRFSGPSQLCVFESEVAGVSKVKLTFKEVNKGKRFIILRDLYMEACKTSS